MKKFLLDIKIWLQALSFRSGVIVAACCAIFYTISFAQLLLPVSAAVKTALWIIFFGLAKAAQYTAILILGKAGIERLRRCLRRDA